MPAIYFTGFETGDTKDLVVAGSGMSVQTTIKRSGAYALKAAGGGENSAYTGSVNVSTLRARFYFYLEHITNPGAEAAGYPLILRTATDVLVAFIRILHEADGTRIMQIVNGITNTVIGVGLPVPVGFWNRFELGVVVHPTAGEIEFRQDGKILVREQNLNTGSANITSLRPASMEPVGLANFYYDDVLFTDGEWPGPGQCVAVQGKAGTPTYDAWTKTAGQTAAQVWSETPFSAVNEAHSTAVSQAQTMLVASLANTFQAIDVINACSVVMVAKELVTGASGTYSMRRRLNGTDTDTVVNLTSSDAIYRDGIWTTSRANLLTAEIGMLRGTGGVNNIQVEDMWLIVDFSFSNLDVTIQEPVVGSGNISA